mgnify:CR=1 FL=1
MAVKRRFVHVVSAVAMTVSLWGTVPVAPTPVHAEGASGAGEYLEQVNGRLDVGGSHACAVADDGQLFCWGENSSGQLGVGSTVDADEPVAVSPLPPPGRAQAVALGSSFTCALLVDGAVSCWGTNNYGQLGNGTTDPLDEPPTPVELPAPGFATQITAGEDFVCALLGDGAITCWGDDEDGQLANGADGDQTAPPAPIDLPGSGVAVSVSAGEDHACAILSDGAVTCWGRGDQGRLGYGDTLEVEEPTELVSLPSPGTATAVAAGSRHTCVVLTDGDVTCWGSDSEGSLGNGGASSADVLSPPTPISMPGGLNALVIAAHNGTTCAVVSTGDVTCWGSANSYRLGTGSLTDAPSPTGPVDLSAAAFAVAVGSSTVCALVGSEVVCWGGDSSGTAGVGAANGNALLPSDPFDVPGANPVVGLGSYLGGTCSVQQTSGTVRCWGLNDDGQLGQGTSDSDPHDTPTTAALLPAPNNASMVDGYMEHVCARQTGGEVACWGLDQSGQVGNGAATSGEEPTPVAVTLPAPGTALDVAAGYAFTCAVLSDGDITCWGDDSDGQLGNGATTGVVHAPPAPITLPSPGTAVAVDAGNSFACAVLSNNTVTCWGADNNGQAGNGSGSSADVTAPPAAITLPSPGTATDVQAGLGHACALLTDGKVACWGDDIFGSVGNGPSGSTVSAPVLITLPSPGTASALALGWRHSCALLTDGSVTCWGHNSGGQLGQNDRTSRDAPPAPIALPADAVAITAGEAHTCAALTTGEVTCWGDDQYGQLGDGAANGDFVTVPDQAVALDDRPVWIPDFTPLPPARILDTRATGVTIDGQFQAGGTVAGGATLELQVAGRGGVAPNAEAAALNVTAVAPTGTGWVTVFPCGQPRPNASNLNVVSGVNVANAVVAQLGTDGTVCLYASVAMHLIADVTGSAPASSAFTAAAPERFMETRSGAQFTTIDGQFEGDGQLAAGTTTELQIAGRGSSPVAANIEAVILNVTAVTPPGNGYLTVYPCGDSLPTVSNLNFVPGRSTPNSVLVALGDGGAVCLFNSTATHLIVDVVGVLNVASHADAPSPRRLLETRVGLPFVTFDGSYEGGGKVPADATRAVQVAGRATNADARFVWLNVTAIQAEAGGFVTVYACGQTRPNASNLNFSAGVTVANSVLVELGEDGDICIYTSATTHLVVDLDGVLIDGYAPIS